MCWGRMVVIVCDEMIYKLERFINQYDKILIWDQKSICDKNLINDFGQFLKQISSKKKYLIMMNDMVALQEAVGECFADIILISKEEMDFINKLYRMYEFSDRIILIAESNNFPGIFNYLCTGVLSKQECFEALVR